MAIKPLPPLAPGDSLVHALSVQAADVLHGLHQPVQTARVLESLAQRTTSDIQFVVDAQMPECIEGHTEIHMPFGAAPLQAQRVCDALDFHPEFGGIAQLPAEREKPLKLDISFGLSQLAIAIRQLTNGGAESFYHAAAKRSLDFCTVDDKELLADLRREMWQSLAVQREDIGAVDDDEQDDPPFLHGGLDLFLLGRGNADSSLAKHQSVYSIAAAYRRALQRPEHQQQLLRSLKQFMLLPEAHVAMSLTRQGSRELRNIPAMTDYDEWLQIYRMHAETLKKHNEVLAATEISMANIGIVQSTLTRVRAAEEGVQCIDLTVDSESSIRLGEPTISDIAPDAAAKEIVKVTVDLSREEVDQLSEILGQKLDTVLSDDQMDELQAAIDYLQKNKRPQHVQALRTKLKAGKKRRQLESARKTFNVNRVAALEKAIMEEIYGELCRFGHAIDDGRQLAHLSYQHGTPQFVLDRKELNCVMGPWLMAVMAMECGIRYQQLLYCTTNQTDRNSADTPYGLHGALLLVAENMEMWIYDPAGQKDGLPLRMKTIKPGCRRWVESLVGQMGSMEKESDCRENIFVPAKVEVDEKFAGSLGLFSHMHIMPVDQACSALSLMNTGIAFQDAEEWEEARRSYELALALFPNSPDLLFRYGETIKDSKPDEARACFEASLRQYPHHMESLFQLGVLKLHAGEHDEAMQCFTEVMADPRSMWSRSNIKMLATQLVHSEAELLDAKEK